MFVRDASNGEIIHTLRGHSNIVTGVAFSPDGRRLVAAGYSEEVLIWGTQSGTTVLVLNRLGPRAGTGGQNPRAVFSPDGTWIATQNYNAALTLWDARCP